MTPSIPLSPPTASHWARTAFLLLFVGFLVDATAVAQCNGPVEDVLTCSSVVNGRLRPGAWGAGTPAPAIGALGPECSTGFETLNSDLGAVCNYTNIAGVGCLNGGGACVGDFYSCGSPNVPLDQNGPDDVYAFTCQQSGDVTVTIDNLDCDLDIYILDDTCDPITGCVAGATAAFAASDQVNFYCTEGVTYHIVVEGFGHTYSAWNNYGNGAGYCNPEVPASEGNYTLHFETGDPATAGCVEDCVNGIDDDGDNDIDCDDSDCAGDPACPSDPCDADGDGFIAMACGGGDCDDTVVHTVDPDGDGVPSPCDNCELDANVDQADADADNRGDACDLCEGSDDLLDGDADGVPDGCDVCLGADDGLDDDGDGIPNGCDSCVGDPTDTDGDGVADACDACPGHDDAIDTDGDGFADGCDACDGFDDALDSDADGFINALDPDSDNDGLTDGDEVNEYETDPNDPDTDDGGVSDGDEVDQGLDPLDASDDVPVSTGKYLGGACLGCASGGGSSGGLWVVLLSALTLWRRRRDGS